KLEASYGQSDEWQHRYYYHPDHLGSAQLITDFEGNEYQRIEYTPYGELWVEKKTAKEEGLRYLPYKFTAKEQDEETGLYYYGARYLDAKYSRWMSADPAVGEYIPMAPLDDEAKKHNGQLPGQGGIFNVVNFQLYHYAGNNPVKYTDPDGETIFLIGWASSAGCGTGVAENLGVYFLTDWKGNVSIGFYSTSSYGAYVGIGASTGVEFTIAPFADEFSDIEGYSLSAGGSGGLFGLFSVGGEVGFNPFATTNKDQLQSLTISIAGSFNVPGGSPGEGHIYNNYTIKLSEFKILDKKKALEIQENMAKFYGDNDYEELTNYLRNLSQEYINE
ncbi:RHS repeat domain-containing protein, partial [Treponema socranskii]